LIKSLYGLKQAPRAWHARLSSVLGLLGFAPSAADSSLFILHRPQLTVYLLVYVDDIIVVSSTASAIPRLIAQLRSEFSVKDLGTLHYFLGIEVDSRTPGSLLLRQHKYSLDLLARAGMLKCSPAHTPMAASDRLSAFDGDVLSADEATKYRSIVGGLQYLTITRPDLSFVVNKVCQYLHEPRSSPGPLSNGSFAMCDTLLMVVFGSGPLPRLCFLLFPMLIGLAVQMIGDQPGDMLYSMEVI
jgi:histone deacetylase 1/2